MLQTKTLLLAFRVLFFCGCLGFPNHVLRGHALGVDGDAMTNSTPALVCAAVFAVLCSLFLCTTDGSCMSTQSTSHTSHTSQPSQRYRQQASLATLQRCVLCSYHTVSRAVWCGWLAVGAATAVPVQVDTPPKSVPLGTIGPWKGTM
jgi:hypothetical protein